MPQSLCLIAVAVLMLNLPFGYWRAGAQRFSRPWLVAVHAPVPLMVGLRVASGLGWQLSTFPIMVGAFVAGQYLGGTLRRVPQKPPENM